MKLNINTVTIVAILCLTALEGLAVYKGTDGTFFGIVVSAIAALGGYQVGLNTPTPTPPPQQ